MGLLKELSALLYEFFHSDGYATGGIVDDTIQRKVEILKKKNSALKELMLAQKLEIEKLRDHDITPHDLYRKPFTPESKSIHDVSIDELLDEMILRTDEEQYD